MPKLNLTIAEDLMGEIDTERAESAPTTSRSAFVRRIVERAAIDLRRERWDEASDFAGFTKAPDEDPYEFVTWPGYPHDDYTETLIARIKSF